MRWALLLAVVVACDPQSRLRLELVEAPKVDNVAPLVAAELAKATRDEKQLLVYVGAVWCEPCRRFHDAAAAGQLDAKLAHLRLLVFDLDRDDKALAAAGYTSKLIPLFAIPKPDGTSSARQIEGGIKGEGAVAQITPRLQQLLGDTGR